jgi:predicted ATP-grasp superfamily ATP-dependent carboligase
VITPELDIIENIYDKSSLLAIAKRCNVPIPITQHFKSADDKISSNLSFPVITRGRHGLSFYKTVNKKALLANNEQELRAQLQWIAGKYKIEGTFTQELIRFNGSNKTISFTAFCVNGDIKTHWMGVKLREHPLRFGTATFSKSVYIPECYQLSVPLLKVLNYTGVCEVEYLFDPETKQYKLIEINARTWLWVGLARACGVDYAKMIYNFVNRYAIDYPQTYETGKCWINPITDIVYGVYGILKGKVNPVRYLSSLAAGRKVNALFNRRDLKPGFVYLFSILSFLNQR